MLKSYRFILSILIGILVSTSAHAVKNTYDAWIPTLTIKFSSKTDTYSGAIRNLLMAELPIEAADKTFIEIGSGPQGGILKVLGDMPHITPSEANAESFAALKLLYPRAIQASAQNVAEVVQERYDFVVLSNVMDCIMFGEEEDIDAAFSSLKRILKPGGKIIVLQVNNPATDFIFKYIRERHSKYIALPHRASLGLGGELAEFFERGVTLVPRAKVTIPLQIKGHSNLDEWIRGTFSVPGVNQLYAQPDAFFQNLVNAGWNFFTWADQIAEANTPENNFKEIGISSNSFNKIFFTVLNLNALKAGLRATITYHKTAIFREGPSEVAGQDTYQTFGYEFIKSHNAPTPAGQDSGRYQRVIYSIAVLESI